MKNQVVYTLTITTEDLSKLFELVKKRKPTDADLMNVVKTVGDLRKRFKIPELTMSILEYICFKIGLLPDD